MRVRNKMKKLFLILFSIFLVILIFFTYFSINKFMSNDLGAYLVSDVIKNKYNLMNTKIKVIGVPGCSQFQTDYFNYYYLYLSNNDNQFKGIYVNFDIAVGDREKLFGDNFKYWYNSYIVMIEGKKNCYDIFDKIAIEKKGNKIIIEGVLTKTFNDNDLELRLI